MNDGKTSCRPCPAELLISVVLPVYNEDSILPLLAAQLTRLLQLREYEYEIIFVNDGSQDQSGTVLDQ
ncbi:MAG: glycosyltransferase, partial [Thermoguttaceae bacterium]